MYNMLKKSLCLAFLLSTCSGHAVTPYYSIRSQSENAARELAGAGWNTQINLCDMDKWYGNFAITPEYTRSFRPCRIAQSLFGYWGSCSYPCYPCGPCDSTCNPCCTPCCDPCCDDTCYRVKISGSQVDDRGCCDWLADNFGLPTDYQSCVTFEPRIDNFLIDFNFYLGFDEWCQGLYLKIHAPVVHTKWDLNMCECIENAGENHHWRGYFNSAAVTSGIETYGILRNNLVSNFTSFISGCGIINANDINFNPLCYAKMDCCRHTKTALSDIQMALGWNVCCDEDYHVGLNVRATAPTGNRPEASYLFEPIVGNGKHWELGGGLSSHWTFWRSEDEEQSCAFFFDANVSHLFKAKQVRTFDLCSKPLSRYMLAAKFNTSIDNLVAGDTSEVAEAPNGQFSGIYTPVANLTTMSVDVSIGVQADLAFMFQYLHNNWSFDFGYNFWGKSCEKIECRSDCCPYLAENTWVLKGDAFMYGFYDDQGTITPVALSASQYNATIYQGTNNYPNGIDNIVYYRNPGVDNKKLAWNSAGGPLYVFKPTTEIADQEQIYTSKDPRYISFCDIDFYGARNKGISHKVFAHFDYTWSEHEEWIPYLGIGGEVEFGHCKDSKDSCNPCCTPCGTTCGYPCDSSCNPCYDNSCCNHCALSQWGIWLKGGVAFN